MISKQPALGREVLLHVTVIIEMILRQVGETADRKIQSANTVLLQRVGAHLHDGHSAFGITHGRQVRL